MKREDIAAMGPLQRKELLEDVAALLLSGEWRFGEVVRFLRAVVLRKNRHDFAQLVGISTAALQKLEDRAEANPTLDTLNRVLRPFGGAVGLVFPRMAPAAQPTREVEQRRTTMTTALQSTRRRTNGTADQFVAPTCTGCRALDLIAARRSSQTVSCFCLGGGCSGSLCL